MKALENKVALITGASSGIGHATAKLFAREGAKVVVGARREPDLRRLVEEIQSQGGTAALLAGDVTDESFAEKLVRLAVERFGGLDVAFNNAGSLGAMRATAELKTEEWEQTLRTNLTSAFWAAKFQLPVMLQRGGGSMIFTSTFVGYSVGFPQMAAYAAAKSGLIGLTQSLAAEVGPRGVRVNALLPGGTDTPSGPRALYGAGEALEFVKGLHALKRIAQPEEIARSALYLASEASSFTTGVALLVDGGISISRS